jgi:hypothetical protein
MKPKDSGLKRKRTLCILSAVIVVLVLIRLALPFIALHYANKTLANIKGYYGHIEDIDIALLRGAYKVDSVYLNKKDSATQIQTPFFSAQSIGVGIEWRAIFQGSLVAEIVLEEPVLRFTRDKVEPKQIIKDSTRFTRLLDEFMPLHINRFEITNGKIQYIDQGSKPPVDIAMTNTYVIAQNLRNSYDSTKLLPAKIDGRANVYDGTFSFNVNLNPLANSPTFDMNAEIKNTNLAKLNDFFKAYANIDVNKGIFGMYTEAAANEGKFKGYVKPLIKDLDVLGKEDKKDGLGQKIWEGFAGTIAQLFKNQAKDQLATKIPFEGNLKDPKTNIWSAIWSILKNAFVQALKPSVDNDININSIGEKKPEKKGFLKKIFSRDKKNKK